MLIDTTWEDSLGYWLGQAGTVETSNPDMKCVRRYVFPLQLHPNGSIALIEGESFSDSQHSSAYRKKILFNNIS